MAIMLSSDKGKITPVRSQLGTLGTCPGQILDTSLRKAWIMKDKSKAGASRLVYGHSKGSF